MIEEKMSVESCNFFSKENKQRLILEGEEVKLVSETDSNSRSSFISFDKKIIKKKEKLKWTEEEISLFYKVCIFNKGS